MRSLYCLHELHDVDAAPTGGTHRGCRCRLAGLDLELNNGFDFLSQASFSLELLDLEEVQFDGRLSTEEADQYLDLVALGAHFINHADELGKRPVDDTDVLSAREGRPAPAAPASVCLRIALTSRSRSGIGLFPEPTKLVTPGVFRTTNQDSSRPVAL